ncbi:hypothetical protein FI667_g11343, partial [Globisporangium splendens]
MQVTRMRRDAQDGARATAEPAVLSPLSISNPQAKACWRKLRAATFVLCALRDRHGAAKRSTQPETSMSSGASGRKPQHTGQPAYGGKRTDARSVVVQMGAWYASNRDLFQRTIVKPIQDRSDVETKLLTFYDGEVLCQQGDAILDTSGRFLVVQGSLFVYRNTAYAQQNGAEPYAQWFHVTNTGLAKDGVVKYGDCIGTCGIGDTCGDVVVLCITQAAYKRVTRFNVNCDLVLLNEVASAFRPAKGNRVDNACSTIVITSKLNDDVLGDAKQLRRLHRFVARFACFRILPQQYWVELLRKCEYRVVKNDEVLCHASSANPHMFMVLSGTLCVRYTDPFEAKQLRSYDEKNYAFDPPLPTTKINASLRQNSSVCLAECELPKEVALLSQLSSHVCTLASGDAFGESGVRARALLQGATLFNPITSAGPCTVLALSYDDYHAAWNRYLEATEFTPECVYNVLTNVLPQDRTCEQIGYLSAFLTRKSPAKVFFNQLPTQILHKICLHASLETYKVGDDAIIEFVQNEDDDVNFMRVVLNGCVCAFKNKSRHPCRGHGGSPTQIIAPKAAVLRRFQSKLLRGNTKRLDEMYTETARCRSTELESEGRTNVQTVDPVCILPHGAAFDQHQIFTNSKSPYSYAAYSAGLGPSANPLLLQDNTIGKAEASAAGTSSDIVYVLSIPARFVKLCFTTLDEYLTCNLVRMFKRIAKAKETSAKSGVPICELVQGLQMDRLLFLNPCFSGIPRTRLQAAASAEVDVAVVPPRRILYEMGESTRGTIYFVLSGNVRTFTVYVSSKNRQQQQKPEEKKLPKLLRKASRSLHATHAAMEKKYSSHVSGLEVCAWFDGYERTRKLNSSHRANAPWNAPHNHAARVFGELASVLPNKIGRSRYSRSKESQNKATPSNTASMAMAADWLVDLYENDVFGEEVCFDACIGSNRLTTAVAATANRSEGDTELLYLSRQQIDEIQAPYLQIASQHKLPSPGIRGMLERSNQLLSIRKHCITSRQRWQLAINHVIQGRAQRSRWSSVLLQAKRHRVELILQLCASSMLQTYAQDSIVIVKGDAVGDRCFLVLTGSVTVHQVCNGASYSPGISNSFSLPLATGTSSSVENTFSSVKVAVQTLRAGDIFGDFELLAGKTERQIHAVASTAATKLLTFPREEFCMYWPRTARLNAKLTTIKNAFYGVHNLDSDRLCSLYYAMQEKCFKRNEGSILFTEKQEDVQSGTGSRRKSSKPQTVTANSVDAESEKDFVVADSPVVETFSLQLFPCNSKHNSVNSSSRNPELFVAVVLGKHGLSAIRKHLNEHRAWRTKNTAYTSRVVESSVSKKETLPTATTASTQTIIHKAPTSMPGLHPLALTRFLKDRQLLHSPPELQPTFGQMRPASPTDPPMSLSPASPTQSQPIDHPSPSKAHAPLGSFGVKNVVSSNASLFPPIGSPPVEAAKTPELVSTSRDPTLPVSSALKGQLRKEKLVLDTLSKSSKSEGIKKTDLEKQIRRRHGRPPPKIVENRGMFVDEHVGEDTQWLQ